ncbi:MAG TPA: helix-turn-helix transcriptional regulator [Caulobacteraceae bacterium]|jgi:DNA-binding CsgD family transcriptional regulator
MDDVSVGAARLDRLTPKELACLRLVAKRLSSDEIAAELGIAKTSVDTYCDRARAKLGVSRRSEAARLVLQAEPRSSQPEALLASANPKTSEFGAPLRSGVGKTLGLLLLTGFALALTLGSLLAGLHALDAMAPAAYASAAVSTHAK